MQKNSINFLNNIFIGTYKQGYGAVNDVSVRERTEFLRKYAADNDLPIIYFGE